MAAATYTTNFSNLVADSSATTNWNATGGGASGLNVETDYFIQGTRCISKNAWAGAEKGMIEDTTNNLLSSGSGNAVYMWVTHHTPGSLAIKANGGINILLGSSGTVYNEYDYAGSDTIDYGAPWICAVVDPDNATPSAGSVAVADMDCYGAQANLPVGGPTKGSPFGIDEIRYGRNLLINDGVGVPATFTEAASNNDNINNRWGMFQRTPGSATNFTMQCRMQFGNAAKCEFSDSNKNITINDLEHVASSFIEFDVTQASDISLTNINIIATAGGNTKGNWVTTSAGTCSFTSCNFTNMGTFGLSAGYTITNTTFRGCDLVTQNGATITDCNFDSSVSSVSLTVSDLSLVTGNTFTSDGSNHAVDLGIINTNTGDLTWNNTLSGYSGTGANAAILVEYNDTNSNLIINVTGGTTPTVNNTGTGNVVVQSSVPLSVKVVDGENNPITTAAVRIEETNGTLVAQGNASSGVDSNEFTSSFGGTTPLTVRIKVRSSSSGETRYFPVRTGGEIQASSGLSTTITMTPDTIASA